MFPLLKKMVFEKIYIYHDLNISKVYIIKTPSIKMYNFLCISQKF